MTEFFGLFIKYFFGNSMFLISTGATLLGGRVEHRLDMISLGILGVFLASVAVVHSTRELKSAWMELRS